MTTRYADVSILMAYIVVLQANIARTTVCIVPTINNESCPLKQTHCCIPDNQRGIQSKTRWICVIIYIIVQKNVEKQEVIFQSVEDMNW